MRLLMVHTHGKRALRLLLPTRLPTRYSSFISNNDNVSQNIPHNSTAPAKSTRHIKRSFRQVSDDSPSSDPTSTPPPLKTIMSAYKPPSTLPSSIPQTYHVNNVSLRLLQLEYISKLNSQNPTLNPNSQKPHVLLTSPHPGSIPMLSHIIQSTSKTIGAGVLELDYLTLKQCALEAADVGLIQHNSANNTGPSNLDPVLRGRYIENMHRIHPKFLKSFNPAQFELDDEDDDDVGPWHEEMDEEDEDDDEDDFGEDDGNSRPQRHIRLLSGDPPAVNVVINQINPVTGEKSFSQSFLATPESSSGNAPVSFGSAGWNNNESGGVPNIIAALRDGIQTGYKKFIESRKNTIYGEGLSILQYQTIFNNMMDYITKLNEPVVIHIKDMTDIIEIDSENGAKLISTLNESIANYNKRRIELNNASGGVVLTVSCSPPLTEQLNAVRGKTFYQPFFNEEEEVVYTNSGSEARIWEDGMIYQTPLDLLTEFDKISIPIIQQPRFEELTPDMPCVQWLEQMEKDQRSYIVEMNIRNLLYTILQKGYSYGDDFVSLRDSMVGVLEYAESKMKKIKSTTTRQDGDEIVFDDGGYESSDVFADVKERIRSLEISVDNLRILHLTLSAYLWETRKVENVVTTAFGVALSRSSVQTRQIPPWSFAKVLFGDKATESGSSTTTTGSTISKSPQNGAESPSSETPKILLEHLLEAILLVDSQEYLLKFDRELGVGSGLYRATRGLVNSPSDVFRTTYTGDIRNPTTQADKFYDNFVEKLDKLRKYGNSKSISKVNVSSSKGLAPFMVSNVTPSQMNEEEGEDDEKERDSVDDQKASSALKRLLNQRGHKLNSHEKKILGTVVHPHRISVEFSDIVLAPQTKLVLQTLVTLPLLRPEFFSQGILQRHAIHGVLLFGPPGTGKTMLAKAVAKAGGARFMAISLSDVFDKYVGEGEKNVKAIFTLARKLSPCVVFLDEVDALFGSRRGDALNTSRREVINEFMSEWDGLTSNNNGVIILGATNRPFDLDDAILRRMPRRVMIDLPNEQSRQKILSLHLKDEHLSNISIDILAKQTELYSGSDLKNLCVAAALVNVKETLVREMFLRQEGVVGDDSGGSGKEGGGKEGRRKKGDEITREEILKRMEMVEDWSGIAKSETIVAPVKRILTKEHFDIAFTEVPPSLTDEAETLMELRKWDKMYGEGGGKKKKSGWGFNSVVSEQESIGETRR